MNKRQNGFSAVGLFCAILVICVIAMVGLYVFKNSDVKPSNSSGPKTYSDQTFGFSFVYPDNFELDEILSNNNVVHLQLKSSDKSPTILMSAAKISYERDAYSSVSSILDGTHKLNKNVISKQTKLTIDDLPAVEYESRDGYIYQKIQIDTSVNTHTFAIDVSDGATNEHIDEFRTIAKSFKVSE